MPLCYLRILVKVFLFQSLNLKGVASEGRGEVGENMVGDSCFTVKDFEALQNQTVISLDSVNVFAVLLGFERINSPSKELDAQQSFSLAPPFVNRLKKS